MDGWGGGKPRFGGGKPLSDKDLKSSVEQEPSAATGEAIAQVAQPSFLEAQQRLLLRVFATLRWARIRVVLSGIRHLIVVLLALSRPMDWCQDMGLLISL